MRMLKRKKKEDTKKDLTSKKKAPLGAFLHIKSIML